MRNILSRQLFVYTKFAILKQVPRQNLQKKSDDRIVKDSKKLNIIIRRKYVLSLSRENEFSSSMTS